MTIDRFEGDVVVLTDESGDYVCPLGLLPYGVRPGDVLAWSVERDAAKTNAVREETAAVQDELAGRDPGGDLTL